VHQSSGSDIASFSPRSESLRAKRTNGEKVAEGNSVRLKVC